MSMKAQEANEKFQKKVKEYDNNLARLEDRIDTLELKIDRVLDAVSNISLNNVISEKPHTQTDKLKITDNSDMFIPEINVSEFKTNMKEDKSTVKELDLESDLVDFLDFEKEDR